jgi:hypothetical protein
MTVGATSGGGMAAFVFSKFFKNNKQVETENYQDENQRSERKKAAAESPTNRLGGGMGDRAPETAREGERID